MMIIAGRPGMVTGRLVDDISAGNWPGDLESFKLRPPALSIVFKFGILQVGGASESDGQGSFGGASDHKFGGIAADRDLCQ